MFAQTFRFDHTRFRNGFELRKPRHRLLRFALGLVGLGVLALLVMFSVVLGAAMIAGGLVWRLWARRKRPTMRDPRVVDGEYRVVERPVLSVTRRA